MKRLLWLLFAAVPAFAQFGPPKDFTVTAAERDQVIKGSIAKLNENYVFPDVAKKMGDAVAARAAKGEYDSITSAKEFAATLTRHLREISHDRHLHVDYFADPLPMLRRAAQEFVPGGSIVLSWPARRMVLNVARRAWLATKGVPVSFYSDGEIAQLAEAVGGRVARRVKSGLAPLSVDGTARIDLSG
jgi:hypothetical protein